VNRFVFTAGECPPPRSKFIRSEKNLAWRLASAGDPFNRRSAIRH
jgi:hypothetical protein